MFSVLTVVFSVPWESRLDIGPLVLDLKFGSRIQKEYRVLPDERPFGLLYFF